MVNTDIQTRIGVQLAPQHTSMKQSIDAVRWLEDAGVDIAFNWDHFFPLSGDPNGRHFEATTQLAAWAVATERIQLGPLVFCYSYRNANLLADVSRTIDDLSNGRFVFGIGSGWFERDYDEYGYAFGTAGQRLDALAEGLPVIRSRWTRLNPPPFFHAPEGKIGMPILIGGGGERKTLRIVAEHADIWHSFANPTDLEHKLDVLRRHADDVGRDLSTLEISNGASVRDGIGAADFERLDALHSLGTRLFTIALSGDDTPEGFDLQRLQRYLNWRDDKNS